MTKFADEDHASDDSEGLPDAGAVERKNDSEYEDLGDDGALDKEAEGQRPFNLHPKDPLNFLKLAAAIKLLTAEVVTEADLTEADSLLRSYCKELIEVFSQLDFCVLCANQLKSSMVPQSFVQTIIMRSTW